jgi:hypothetical protein
MDGPYQSPGALERALNDRIAQRYPKSEVQARRNEVAYRRLVARMFTADPDAWVLKGGFAMILRLDPNRTSNDIDATYVAQAGGHALAVAALERAVALDLEDFFRFEIVGQGEETEDRARRIAVLCRLGTREFARCRVDLSVPQPNVPFEIIHAPPLSGIAEVDGTPPLRVLAWSQQIADKTCAVFEIRGDQFSSRSRDLADLGMIADQIDGLDGSELTQALRDEEKRRQATLPNGLPATFRLAHDQEVAWRTSFPRASRQAPIEFDAALGLATRFIEPLLDGSAIGRTWDNQQHAYVSHAAA